MPQARRDAPVPRPRPAAAARASTCCGAGATAASAVPSRALGRRDRRGGDRARRRRRPRAVSMARVAKELGFTTMSLYRYVTSKDELLQLMWNASAQGAEELVLEGDGWRDRLRMWAMIQREMIDRHPWITQMPMAAPPMAPNSLTFVETRPRGTRRHRPGRRRQAARDRPAQLLHAQRGPDGRTTPPAPPRAGAQPPEASRPPGPSRRCCASWSTSRRTRGCTSIAWSAVGHDQKAFGATELEEFRFGVERILDGVERLMEERGSRKLIELQLRPGRLAPC